MGTTLVESDTTHRAQRRIAPSSLWLASICVIAGSALSAIASPDLSRALDHRAFAAIGPKPGDLVIGAGVDTLVLTRDTVVNGSVYVVRGGVLVIRRAKLEVHGDVYLFDSASVSGDGGTLSLPQDYVYQRSVVVGQRSRFVLRGTTVDITMGNANASVSERATWEYHGVTLPDNFFTMIVGGHGTFSADSCTRCGEFIFQDTSTSSFTNSGMIISWPWLQRGQQADVTFPDTVVARWAFPDSARTHSGIVYHVGMLNCRSILWMVLHASGASLTIRDSKVRAIGVVIRGTDSLGITGLADGATFSDWTFPDPDRTLRLINSSVQTWNWYPFDAARLSLTNCIFGELLAAGFSNVMLNSSTCDGSGGYFSATDSAHVQGVTCLLSCQVVARMRSTIFMIQSTIWFPGPFAGITAERSGSLLLANCNFNVIPQAFDTSLVVIVGVDPPGRMIGGRTYEIPGGAAIIGGPVSIVRFRQYALSYAPMGSPDWKSIGSPVTQPVVRGILGTWTPPITPGIYGVQLCLFHNFPDSICVSSTVVIDAPSGIAADPADPNLFAIWPQPARDVAHVRLPAGARGVLRVYDVLGAEVLHLAANDGEIEIPVGSLARGVYRCVAMTEEGVLQIPLVVR